MALYSNDESSTKVDNSKELPCMNILSVDFDWIMEPMINAYNHFIRQDGKAGWGDIERSVPGINQFVTCDLQKYADICRYLCNICCNLKSDDFYYGVTHEEIMGQVAHWATINPDKQFKIWNIDHHHDCGYSFESLPEDAIQQIIHNDVASCANWVMVLTQVWEDRFAGYTWIGNKNSEEIVEGLDKHLPPFKYTTDIKEIDEIMFDKVFICLSPGWVPPKYYDLFASMAMLLEKIVNK